MFITSVNPVMAQALAEAILAALSLRPSAALLATPTVHLYTAGPSPITPQATPGEFTEATFSGYSAVSMGTLLGPILLPGPDGYGVHVACDFLATPASPFVPNTIVGYWVDNGSTTYYYGEAFPTPIGIAVPTDFISLELIFGQTCLPSVQ